MLKLMVENAYLPLKPWEGKERVGKGKSWEGKIKKGEE